MTLWVRDVAVLSGSSLSLLHAVWAGIQPELLVDGAAWGRSAGESWVSFPVAALCPLASSSFRVSPSTRPLSCGRTWTYLHRSCKKREREGAAALFSSEPTQGRFYTFLCPSKNQGQPGFSGRKQTPPLGGERLRMMWSKFLIHC